VGRRSQLNDRQLALLQRVASGDDLATAANGDKRSASALHNRGLLLVRRSPWGATITEAGRFYPPARMVPRQDKDLCEHSRRTVGLPASGHERIDPQTATDSNLVDSAQTQAPAAAHHGPDLG
jgi:hypothetical protein